MAGIQQTVFKAIIFVISAFLLGWEYVTAPDVLDFSSKEAIFLMGLSSVCFSSFFSVVFSGSESVRRWLICQRYPDPEGYLCT